MTQSVESLLSGAIISVKVYFRQLQLRPFPLSKAIIEHNFISISKPKS